MSLEHKMPKLNPALFEPLQLRLQHPQLSDARHCQTTFGLNKSVRGTKFGSLGKELQAPLIGFGAR